MGGLQRITETCSPRADVLRGGLSDNHFAAQLDQVVRNPERYPIYGDPTEFFQLTYPTDGLKALLTRTFGRLVGAKVPGAEHGIIRSETSFGGGKTHGLMAVFHLATGARPLNIGEFIDPALLPDECQIAAVVADTLDPENGLVTNDMRSFTIWGEIGAQLGADPFSKVRLSDEQRTAPGKATLAEMVGDIPTIIIIDEIAQYLRQLTSSGNPDTRRLAEAVPVFLKNLFELAAGNPKVVVIITLATRSDAFGAETDELKELLDSGATEFRTAFQETISVVNRPTSGGSIIQPAADFEIAEILKRRLFSTIDASAAWTAADAFRSFYESIAARGETLAGGADQPATYAAAVESSYPFHPELVRVLDKRLSTIPGFQRARGALKLLAEAIGSIWSTETPVEIINVADLDYGNDAVLSHLTIGLGRAEFKQVAEADFAGNNSHAAQIDRTRFADRPGYATRACRTVFTHSLEMVKTAGAGRSDYLLGTMQVGDEPEVISEALAAAEKVAWFLDYDGHRWRFSTEPNANNIVAQEAENVPKTSVNAEVEDRITKTFPTDSKVETIHFPSGPSGVPEAPRLRLVVLHHDDLTLRANKALPPPSRVVDILDKVGANEATRINRNSVVFLVADPDAVEAMKERVRFDMAAQRIVSDAARMAAHTPEVRKRLQAIADTAKLEARIAITRCYRHLYFPSSDKSNGYLRHEELAPKAQGDTDKAQTKVIVTALTDYGKIRTATMSVDYLKSKAWPRSSDEVTTEAVYGAFWQDHGAQIVLDETTVKDAIRDGVKNGTWVYYDAATTRAWTDRDAAAPVQFSTEAILYTPDKAKELGLLGRAVKSDDITDALAGPSATGPAIRASLETAIGKEPPKAEVLEALARAADGGETARVVVVAGAVEPGAKALTPSEVRKASLDNLHVLTPPEADRLSIERSTRVRKTKIVEAKGPAGVAFQSMLDKADDTDGATGFTAISVTSAADPGEGIRDIRLLGQAIPMLPKFSIDIDLSLEMDFRGLTPGVELALSGAAKEYQRVEDGILALAKVATDIAGTMRLDIHFDPAVPFGSSDLNTLRKVLTDLSPGDVRVKALLT